MSDDTKTVITALRDHAAARNWQDVAAFCDGLLAGPAPDLLVTTTAGAAADRFATWLSVKAPGLKLMVSTPAEIDDLAPALFLARRLVVLFPAAGFPQEEELQALESVTAMRRPATNAVVCAAGTILATDDDVAAARNMSLALFGKALAAQETGGEIDVSRLFLWADNAPHCLDDAALVAWIATAVPAADTQWTIRQAARLALQRAAQRLPAGTGPAIPDDGSIAGQLADTERRLVDRARRLHNDLAQSSLANLSLGEHEAIRAAVLAARDGEAELQRRLGAISQKLGNDVHSAMAEACSRGARDWQESLEPILATLDWTALGRLAASAGQIAPARAAVTLRLNSAFGVITPAAPNLEPRITPAGDRRESPAKWIAGATIGVVAAGIGVFLSAVPLGLVLGTTGAVGTWYFVNQRESETATSAREARATAAIGDLTKRMRDTLDTSIAAAGASLSAACRNEISALRALTQRAAATQDATWNDRKVLSQWTEILASTAHS